MMVRTNIAAQNIHRLFRIFLGQVGTTYYRSGRAVSLRAAIEQVQWPANNWAIKHTLDGYLELIVGVGTKSSIMMILNSYPGVVLHSVSQFVHLSGGMHRLNGRASLPNHPGRGVAGLCAATATSTTKRL